MTVPHAVGIAALLVLIAGSSADAQSADRYRDLQIGANLASVSALAAVAPAQARSLHTRPALLQVLEWRRPYTRDRGTAVDPVEQRTFSFIDDQLYRIVIDYDRERTEGMTDADMAEAISTMYGSVRGGSTSIALVDNDDESGAPVATWGDAEHAAVLYRASYTSRFRLVVVSRRLTALAQTAEMEARRLDAIDAPRLERERQQKTADEERASKEKARIANKAAFVP